MLRSGVILGTLTSLVLVAVALADSKVAITLPPDAMKFGPGQGQALALANCTVCHAADYVYMQPPLNKAQWTAEVLKMKTAYHANIPDETVDPLVAYLLAQNGRQ